MDRRQFLAAGALTAATAVAGCSEDATDASDGGDGGSGTTTEGASTTAGATTAGATSGTTERTDTGTTGGGGSTTEEVVVGPGGELAFEPETLRVEPGTEVLFVWDTDNHNVVVDEQPADAEWTGSPGPRDEVYDEGFEFSHTFDVVGTYEYYCTPHVSAGMAGSVLVDPDPSTEPVRDSYESETEIEAVADDWSRFATTPRNVGYRSTTAPEEFVPAWRHALEDDTTLHPPVVADGRLYTWAATRVLALDAATGTVDWTVTDEASGWTGNGGPAVADGVLYAGQSDGVSALDAATGERRWRSDLGEFATSSPTVGDDALFFTTIGDENGTVHALDPTTGDPLWRFGVDDYAFCTPALDGGTVFVASQEAVLYALDADSGAVRWTFDDVRGNASAPAVAGSTVYAVDGSGTAYAFDAATGDVRWTRDVGRASVDSPIVAEGSIVGTSTVDEDTGAVWRLDANTGDEVWRTETTGSGYVASAAADGLAFVSMGQRVAAFDLASGRLRHERDLGVSITDPVVADGAVFVGGEEIHALAAP